MNTLRYATPVLSSLCLAAAAAGQDLDLSEQRVPIHSAEADPVGGAYGIWAAGSNYKTSFHGAMTFVPFCGRGVDENRTLSWRTESVRVGEVELTSGIRGMRPVGDYRFEYDLGGVVEAYDVRAEGLEQTFVISRRPAAGGDLVVTGAIEGNVTATNREAMHGAVLFADATGNGVIGYGAATAFDALGNTVPVTTAVADGRIELRLAGSWLEQAVFPVVVDPLLSNQLFDVGNDAKDVDVYRDGEQLASNVWVVYSVYASATDVDIYVRRFLDGFSGPGATVFSDLTTTWNAQHGQLAGLGGSGAGKVITVFERDFASGDRRVRWHTHRKNDATLSTGASSVPWQSGTSEWRPDVGGTKSSVPGTVALLVFQREPVSPFAETSNSQVVGLKIDTAISSNGAPVGSVFEFAGSTTDEERPAVNQVSEGGIAFSWLVAWQSHNNLASGKWDVVAQRIAGAFGSNGNARHVAYGSYHEVAPAVAGANGRYVVTYGLRQPLTSKPSSDLATHIAAQRLDWGHGDVNGIRPHAESIVYSGGQNQQQNGAVGFDLETESHWVLTYARTTSGSERLLASKIGYDGLETERRAAYDVPGFQPAPGGVCYDEDNARFAIAFAVDTGGSTSTLWGTYMTYEATSAVEYGVGCHPTADPQWTGSLALGSEFGRIELVQAPSNTGAFLIASLATAATPLASFGLPGCTLLVDPAAPDHLATAFLQTNNVGEAGLDLPIPGFVPRTSIFFQWALLEPGSNAAGARLTRGLDVAFRR